MGETGYGANMTWTDAEGHTVEVKVGGWPTPPLDPFDALWQHALADGFDPARVDRVYRWCWSDWFAERGREDVAEAVRVMAAYEMVPEDRSRADDGATWYSTGFSRFTSRATSSSEEPALDENSKDVELPLWWINQINDQDVWVQTRDKPDPACYVEYDDLPTCYRELARAYCRALADGAVPDVVRRKASAFATGGDE